MSDYIEAAAERLELDACPLKALQAAYDHLDTYGVVSGTAIEREKESQERVFRLAKSAIESLKAQRARSREPITVEGLVKMGGAMGRTTHLCERVVFKRADTSVMAEFWGDGTKVWFVDGVAVHSMFAPRNMLDVIERLGLDQ